MAKKAKRDTKPTVETRAVKLPSTSPPERVEPTPFPATAKNTGAAAAPPHVLPSAVALPSTVTIKVPMATSAEGSGYATRRVDVHQMTPEQQQNLKAITRGLEDAGESLNSKKLVKTPSDAIRWILEHASV